jgi:hypothetical protein
MNVYVLHNGLFRLLLSQLADRCYLLFGLFKTCLSFSNPTLCEYPLILVYCPLVKVHQTLDLPHKSAAIVQHLSDQWVAHQIETFDLGNEIVESIIRHNFVVSQVDGSKSD